MNIQASSKPGYSLTGAEGVGAKKKKTYRKRHDDQEWEIVKGSGHDVNE
jgi:hypothetical protein